MNTVYIKELAIGEGRPKICVPICGKTKEAILKEAESILNLPADLVEWRIDWYDQVFNIEMLLDTLTALKETLGALPILCTFRSSKEGGEKMVNPPVYGALAKALCTCGKVDAIDVELFMDDVINREIIEIAHAHGVIVIASNHDFEKTPEKDELIRRMILMDEMGADILKIAVMPTNKTDVLELLMATEEMNRLYTDKPVITMSMGPLGLISRIVGETFGSALTFGAGEKASAPGQLPAKELHMILDCLHESCTSLH